MNFKTIKTFWFSFLLEIFSQIISLFLPIYFSAQVGIIVDHIYNKTSADGIILQTLCIILLIALVSPLAAFLSAKAFLKKSISDDGTNLNFVLHKDINQVRNLGSGSILQLFESDLITYRLNLRTLIVTPIVVSVLTIFLFVQNTDILFLLIVFGVSAIPILFNKLYSHCEGMYYNHLADYKKSRIAFEENTANNKITLILFSIKENILQLHNKNYDSYIHEHGKKDIDSLSFSKAALEACKYIIQVLIIMSFYFLFKTISIEKLAASLFLIYPIGQIIELLVAWIQIIPFIKILKKRVTIFQNFENSHIPVTGYKNLKTENLSYTINERRFLFPNITVNPGDRLLIEGKNGAGKTILLKILTGELKSETGKIMFLNPVPKALGYIPQTSLLFNTGIKENITLGNTHDESAVHDMITLFSLQKPAERNPIGNNKNIFSGGEIKKTDIARSLLNSEGILILDEPTNNLDEKSIEALIKILKTKTIIFTSHDERLKEIATGTAALF